MLNSKKMLSFMMAVIIILLSVISSTAIVALEDSNNAIIHGVIPDDLEAILDSNYECFTSDFSDSLPDAVDLSTSDSFPPVGHQGSVASCTSWAATYYQFGYQVASMKNWNVKNDSNKLFSPKFTYTLTNNNPFGSGTSFEDVYDILSVHGAVRYSQFIPGSGSVASEEEGWCTNTENMRDALRYRVSNYNKLAFSELNENTPIASYNDASLNKMKSFLNDGYILTFISAFDIWDYRVLSSDDGSSHVGEDVCIKEYYNESIDSSHALSIVGYDDNVKCDLNNDGSIQDYEKGAFKIVNSYDTTWGNNGFMWVMYDAFNSVSNASVQNVSNRVPVMYDYQYYVIDVDEYSLDLIAEVSVTAKWRGQVELKLGLSSIDNTVPEQFVKTFLSKTGERFNYSGTYNVVQTATFPFDFGTLVTHPASWSNYYLQISDDSFFSENVVIDSIKIIDSSGKYVINDTEEKIIDARTYTYRYKIGMVGDVDNSGLIDDNDAVAIQRHISGVSILSDSALKTADVNGDGYIDSMDSTCIQRVVLGYDDEFANGVYVNLE